MIEAQNFNPNQPPVEKDIRIYHLRDVMGVHDFQIPYDPSDPDWREKLSRVVRHYLYGFPIDPMQIDSQPQ